MKKVNLEINGIPPSLNSMYRAFNGRIILSKKIREYKDSVLKKHLKEVNDFFYVKSDFYEIEIEFETPEIFRKTDNLISLTSGDVDNMCKAVIDVIFTHGNENDAKVTLLKVRKSYGKEKRTRVQIKGGLFNMQKMQ